MAAATAMNDENINTSPRGNGLRSRQHSTNSLLIRTLESPIKKIINQSDISLNKSSPPAKSGSPRGGSNNGGAPLDHRINAAPFTRSSPLAPIGTNGRSISGRTADLSTPVTWSPSSPARHAGSKTDGLRLHWDAAHGRLAYPTTKSSSNIESPQAHDESQHHLTSLSTQDLSVPDLQDSEIVSMDRMKLALVLVAFRADVLCYLCSLR